MNETEGDKWRRWVLDLAKMLLPFLASWYLATQSAQKGVDRVEGRLDAQTDREQWGRSQDYIEALHAEEQIVEAAEALEEDNK